MSTLSQVLSTYAHTFYLTRVTAVTGEFCFPDNITPLSLKYTDRSFKNKRIIPDGTPSLVYRFFVYMDVFKEKKSLSDQRSVTGCYILPA